MEQSVAPVLGFRTLSLSEITPEQKQVLKDTVAKETTDTELTYFLNVALAQDLNPFTKEVWCIKYGGKLTVQTARDGFLKIAKRDPNFDYIQSAEVREGDVFTMDPISGAIEHRLTSKRGAILGAYAVITRKDKVKVSKYVTLQEYQDGSSSIWKDYTSAMICKCAESVLCKQFANVTGIIAEETIRKDGVTVDGSPSAAKEQLSIKDDLLAKIADCKTPEQFASLKESMPGVLGKLFTAERDEVMEAAKAKSAELKALNQEVPAKSEEPAVAEEPVEPSEQPKTQKRKSMFQKEREPTKSEPIEAEVVPAEAA